MERENRISACISRGKICERQRGGEAEMRLAMARRRAPMEEQEEDVNELADAFIRKFRNQLKIQRNESLKR
ncbi:hypothetical protein CDL15_Pgr026506 [Punica granatum]|uniref:Uncharacterized protein n=1 Tax=Punica granatum TaxID=22663 RepID=A0A218WKP6_PUNGR|nr:hypothetical protein CDL15_Pgr026506 [Punica granatum]PKI43162.1 hypothetical protein CRG98_036468 [Punica granatum]